MNSTRHYFTYYLFILLVINSYFVGAAENADTTKLSPPPLIFNLGGLSDEQIERLKKVQGVIEVTPQADGRVKVVQQSFNDLPWDQKGQKWIDGAENIYEFLAIKGRVGNTQWTHGGRFNTKAGCIIGNPLLHERASGIPIVYCSMFDDYSTKHNEVISLYCFTDSLPGQVQHEMLREVIGSLSKTEKIGEGYVTISSDRIVWQVSEQAFAVIDRSKDKDLTAAYVHRLGSITPKDFAPSVQSWIENEIRWRTINDDQTFEFCTSHNRPFGAILNNYHTGEYFPVVNTIKPYPDPKTASKIEVWEFLEKRRNILWANLENFKIHAESGRFILKGPNLYDPNKPPSLPKEMQGPPKPTEPTPEPKPPSP